MGTLDLSGINLTGKTVALRGQWMFFWNRLLEPGDLEGKRVQADFIDVPGVWSQKPPDGRLLPATGYCTYALDILLPTAAPPLGLKLYSVGTAYKLWIDGQPLVTCGVVGTNWQSMTGRVKPQTVFFTPRRNFIRLVMQVSNFKDRFGGIWMEPIFGDGEKIAARNSFDIGWEMILFGIFLIVGLFYVILFLFTRLDRSFLWFGLCSLLFAARTLSAGEVFLMTLFPGFDFEINYKIMFLSQCLATLSFMLFFRTLFPSEIKKAAVRVTLVLMSAYGLAILATPLSVYSALLTPFFAFLVAAGVYCTVQVAVAVVRKRAESGITLAGLIICFITVLNDILYANMLIRTGHILMYGLFAFSVMIIVILSIRFSRLQAAAARHVLARDLDEKVKEALCEKFGISKREKEVIPYLIRGMGYQEIGERLFIAVSTLRKHIHSIYGKFGVKNRTELDYFLRSGKNDPDTDGGRGKGFDSGPADRQF